MVYISCEISNFLVADQECQNIADISITGLEAASFSDKVTAVAENTSPSEALTISTKTDRVYTPEGGPSTSVTVFEGGRKMFEVVRDNLNQVVVWNPWLEGAQEIGDFTPKEGYKEMICVEAGAVKGWLGLDQGETWEGGVTILATN